MELGELIQHLVRRGLEIHRKDRFDEVAYADELESMTDKEIIAWLFNIGPSDLRLTPDPDSNIGFGEDALFNMDVCLRVPEDLVENQTLEEWLKAGGLEGIGGGFIPFLRGVQEEEAREAWMDADTVYLLWDWEMD